MWPKTDEIIQTAHTTVQVAVTADVVQDWVYLAVFNNQPRPFRHIYVYLCVYSGSIHPLLDHNPPSAPVIGRCPNTSDGRPSALTYTVSTVSIAVVVVSLCPKICLRCSELAGNERDIHTPQKQRKHQRDHHKTISAPSVRTTAFSNEK